MSDSSSSVTLLCERCGDKYERHKSLAENSRWCSRDCRNEWQSENVTGKNHPRYKHGKYTDTDQRDRSTYSLSSDARQRVLERDAHSCQRCGCDVVGGLRESRESAEVHHIIPRSAGGPNTDRNLVTLCWVCHKKAHRDMGKLHETAPSLLDELRDVVCDDEG